MTTGHRARSIVGVAALAVAVGCSGQPESQSPPGSPGVSEAARTEVSARPGNASDGASVDIDVTAAGWERIGTIPNFGLIGLLSFRHGYVAYGTTYPDDPPAAWVSADGTNWASAPLDHGICQSLQSPGPSATRAATDGESVVVVAPGCDRGWAAWMTSDGERWRGSPISGSEEVFEVAFSATPSGWVLFEEAVPLRIRRSGDGLTWDSAEPMAGESPACCLKLGVDPGGSMVLADHLGLFLALDEEMTSRPVDPPYDPPRTDNADADWLDGLIAPGAPSRAWVLFTSKRDSDASART